MKSKSTFASPVLKNTIQNSEIKFKTDHFTATFLLVLISGDFLNLGLGKGKVLLQIIQLQPMTNDDLIMNCVRLIFVTFIE